MYVKAITHAPMHLWLCDNAGPAWQAPCIIALGRELHNNVGLGNACGLEPWALNSPIKVLLAVCLQPVHAHIQTKALRSRWDAKLLQRNEETLRAFTSHLNGEILFFKNPCELLLSCCKNSAAVFLRSARQSLPVFLTDGKSWWQPEQRDKLHAWTNPLPNRHITCSQPATTKPTPRKNKTLWLILNVCLPDHGARFQFFFFFFFWVNSRVKKAVWAPVDSALLSDALISAGI